MQVAWIGLGQMGLPTAGKIAAAGHGVRAYDVAPPAPDRAAGLTLASSPGEAAADCDLLCLAVFSDAQVEAVLCGPDALLAGLKPGTVVAIFTTGSIEAVQALAARAPAGVAVLDTCFSRKQAEIDSGMLTLLIGGDEAAIDRARPAFDSFARAIFHVGGSGAGRAIKLVNNILFAGHLQLAADGLRLAQGLGLDPLAAAAALGQCSGASDVLTRFGTEAPDQMLEIAHRYMVKDVAAAAAAAAARGVDLGTLGAVTATYRAT